MGYIINYNEEFLCIYLGHIKFYKTYKDESLTAASLVRTTGVASTSCLPCYICCSLKVSIW